MHVEEGEGLALRLCVQAKNKPRNRGLPRLRNAAVIARARAQFVISGAYTVEPLNKGHLRTEVIVPYSEVVPYWEVSQKM